MAIRFTSALGSEVLLSLETWLLNACPNLKHLGALVFRVHQKNSHLVLCSTHLSPRFNVVGSDMRLLEQETIHDEVTSKRAIQPAKQSATI